MKNFKYSIAFLAIVALLFTSCSKDEASDTASPDIQDTFQLQFGALLNDFNKQQQTKDHLPDPVECRDADPSYVLVALTDSNDAWVADKNPEEQGANMNDFIKIDIKNNGGSWETDFSPELGLPAGTYFLEYFIVYSADDEVLWVAPREGGAFASSVADPLPQTIVLGAGTKPYVNVDVLCYVPRVEEAFGYIFFDINLIEVENNYCIFVNYCGTTGRDYPAKFTVDVWSDSFGGSDLVIDGAMNSVSGAGNNFAATVLCFPLPPLDGNDVYYVRVTVLDTDAYDLGAINEFEFTISQDDINNQLNDTPRYEHLRINCGDDGGNGECDPENPNDDCDGDTIPNGDDKCPGFDDRLDLDGDLTPNGCDDDRDGDGIDNDLDDCPDDLPGDGYVDADQDGCEDGVEVCNTVITCEIGDDPGSGCEFTFIEGNSTGFFKVNSEADVFNLKNALSDQVGELTTDFDLEGDLVVTINNNTFGEFISKYEIEVHPADENGDMITTCQDMACNSNVEQSTVKIDVELTNDVVTKFPYYIRVKSTACFNL